MPGNVGILDLDTFTWTGLYPVRPLFEEQRSRRRNALRGAETEDTSRLNLAAQLTTNLGLCGPERVDETRSLTATLGLAKPERA